MSFETIGQEVVEKFNDLLAAINAAQQEVENAAIEAKRRIEMLAPPEEYDYEAAAAYLNIPRRTLERRVQRRAISFRRDGRRVLFTKAALDEYRAGGVVPPRRAKALTL